MNTQMLTFLYAAVLHVGGLIAVVVLMATGHLDQATGYPLLAFLLGFGIAAPVSVAAAADASTSAPTRTPAPTPEPLPAGNLPTVS